MAIPLLVLLGLFTLIQLFFYLFIFTRLTSYQGPKLFEAEYPAVSVLVCAWNERENLEALLPLLDAQQYHAFEVLVLDDRSEDGTKEYLEQTATQWKHVRFIRIEQQHEHITSKKYALSVGMKHAKYPVALMTDADCRPVGERWIATMAARLGDKRDVVLGFSPYFREKGLLNWFIRCETFYTAVQYLSFARVGWAYMGVGRNLLYRTSLFFAHRGFYRHKHIVGGDDDLFMNQVATSTNVAIALDPDSFVYSYPKKTWQSWFVQKKRHLSVGKHYRTRNKWLLGLLSGSHSGFWTVGLLVLGYAVWQQEVLLMQAVAVVFGVRWLVQWVVLAFLNRRLDRTVEWYTFPAMDLALYLYYLRMSTLVLFRRKSKITWR
ncbi:glycosyltransferase [Rhabdobacter roseus]|uniref:Glycosyltransferase involved in cell wall biosynthesis n=1 Tax=Rhabdobacter roseus TaxID=1655419 RepID=A0A840TZD2_9BACT|nr:glycosyltransferase involved in cell wall biosynthesis [Rhabdobacter roseus]